MASTVLGAGLTPLLASVTLPFLGEIVTLFFLSAFIAYLCHRVHIPPIAGFLLTGVLIGPSALGLVQDQELIDMMAEVGVILLLFTIGLEFSLEELSRLGRAIFTGGSLQVGSSIAVVTALLLIFEIDWKSSLYTGALVALSSTAIVLGLLDDRAETNTPKGQLSLALLIFQDLAIVLMVLLVPMLGDMEGSISTVLLTLGQAVFVVVLIILLARSLVPQLLGYVARTRRQEIFVLAVVAICLGTAWFTNLAGVSLALGAFLAGLMVSESQYSEHALSEILPFRTIFSAVFFVSVGMLLDLEFVLNYPLLLLGGVVAVAVIKALLAGITIFLLGYPLRIAAAGGLTLAQIGEFSFVLERTGRTAGLSPAGLGPLGEQAFIATTVLLMLATPLLVKIGPRVGQALQDSFLGRSTRGRAPGVMQDAPAPPLEDHVVIIGYGPAGRHLAQVLSDTQIPFVIIEMNPTSAEEAQKKGLKALYGDASRPAILKAAHIEHAKLCVVVINDYEATRRIARLARHINPTLQIVTRTRFLANLKHLQKAGADVVIPEEMETTVRIFSHVLTAYSIPSKTIKRYVHMLREEDYRPDLSKIQEAHLMVLKDLDEEGLHTRTVAVRPGAPVEGKTLEALELRKRYTLTVLAVRRNNETVANPAGEFQLKAGDRLVMIGRSEHFAASADLFREFPDML